MTAPKRETWQRMEGLALDDDAVAGLPVLSPTDHGYFTLDRILGWVLAFIVGAIVALTTVAAAGWCR